MRKKYGGFLCEAFFINMLLSTTEFEMSVIIVNDV